LISRGERLGALLVGRGPDRPRFEPEDLEMLEELAGPAATAVENALLYSRARHAVHMRDEFLSIASHELRTPLSSLQLQLEMLKRVLRGSGSDEERVEAKMETALRQTGRLARLVDGLLDVSRISAGKLDLQLETFDLHDLVGEVVERFGADAARAGCELQIRSTPGVVGRWDRLRIEQVFLNLLSNAAKYAANRPIEIAVGAEAGRAMLTVRDHGIGIAREDLPRIFGLYERAVPIRHFGGLGLGLYIARQIVEAHGGHIRVSAAPSEGSTFTLEIPIAPHEEMALAATH
jgi:signal transduction histidine kinase